MKHELNRERRTLRIEFPGDILSTNAEALRAEVFGILNAPGTQTAGWDLLAADLEAARMVDSVGLNLLVSIIKAVQARGKKAQILTSSAHVRRALRFTRLDQLAEVVAA
jgi:anti-anti-sigma factor